MVPATFQVLRSHKWLMATILDSTNTDMIWNDPIILKNSFGHCCSKASEQWFSTMDDFPSRAHLATSADFLGVTTHRVPLASSEQRLRMLLNIVHTQDNPATKNYRHASEIVQVQLNTTAIK